MKPAKNSRQGQQTARVAPGINIGFLALVFLMAATGTLLYTDAVAPGLAAFVFVLSGWLIALCLHEFGHAVTAYRGGDYKIAETGYLTLDPLSYTHPVHSLLMPAVFMVLGYIALPGGAVYVRPAALRSHHWNCAVSAAGPLATLLCLCLLATPFSLEWYDGNGTPEFWGALAMLAGFLTLSLVWNLLPVPGLDGWGIIEPYLSRDIQIHAQRWRQIGPMLLIVAVITVRPIGEFVFNIARVILVNFDVPGKYLSIGWKLFSFWR